MCSSLSGKIKSVEKEILEKISFDDILEHTFQTKFIANEKSIELNTNKNVCNHFKKIKNYNNDYISILK